jgi:lipopolysaccharide/colanic/teichoic acid biosynthesis glycosyltransferase
MGNWYRRYGKRWLDQGLVVLGLLLIFPLLVVIALLVRVRLGSPVLFRQERPGLDGKPFMIYKFRTMTDERDADGNLMLDEQCVSHLGGFLRSISLGEFFELMPVLMQHFHEYALKHTF